MEKGLKRNINLKVLPQTICPLRFTEIKIGKHKLGKMDENFNIFRSSYKIYSKPEFWNFSFGPIFLHCFCKVLVSSRTVLSYVLLVWPFQQFPFGFQSKHWQAYRLLILFSAYGLQSSQISIIPPTLFIPDGFV